MTLLDRFCTRAGITEGGCREVVIGISCLPYGRNSHQTPDAVVEEWRGTCSTKHLLLSAIAAETWPSLHVALWHRPYMVTPQLAARLWGDDVATLIPAGGMLDVHTFATVDLGGGPIRIDVTAPLPDWDGLSHTPLQCGDGPDNPGGVDPLATKWSLVARYCEPTLREPFIEALTRAFEARRAMT